MEQIYALDLCFEDWCDYFILFYKQLWAHDISHYKRIVHYWCIFAQPCLENDQCLNEYNSECLKVFFLFFCAFNPGLLMHWSEINYML